MHLMLQGRFDCRPHAVGRGKHLFHKDIAGQRPNTEFGLVPVDFLARLHWKAPNSEANSLLGNVSCGGGRTNLTDSVPNPS